MTAPRILIACIGNIFLGDDGFGTEVARQLAQKQLPEGVIVKDYGIRGLDLTYALLESYELVILVDAVSRGREPGTIYLIEPDPAEWDTADGSGVQLEAHAMNPMQVLRAAKAMGVSSGQEIARILIVGCEPADLGLEEDGKLGLSEPVKMAAPEAIALIESLVAKTLTGVRTETALQTR